MKKSIRRFAAGVAAMAIMAASVPVVTAPVFAAGNLVSNSTFESGTSGWGTYKESGGACTLTTEGGKLAFKIDSVGTKNYSVQMFYDIVPMYKNGVYHLSFDISSSTNRFLECMIQQNGGDYTAYKWLGIDATTGSQHIDEYFTMEYESDIMAKLVFNCGIQEKHEGNLPAHTIYLDNVTLELVDDSKVDYSSTRPYAPSINVNQVGYRTGDTKTAVFRDVTSQSSFEVVNASTNQTVYTGSLVSKGNNASAGESNWTGDFSSVKTPGTYFIKCSGLDDSYKFTIGDDVYNNMLNDSVKMLYLQRCGVAVQDSSFAHPACHTSMATVYGTNQQIDVSGGWHDAGDYGRYVVPAAKAVADLLYAYQTTPDIYGDDLGIPESGNGVPDILDEAKFELTWMKKMQASDGGVYHKVTCENFPGYVMPQEETDRLIVTPVSSTATADFCASMALAYEFYKDSDPSFANDCLDRAKKAWGWLQSNPNLVFQNPGDISTGEYGDKSDKDERYWAAAQMYRATGESSYLSAVSANSSGGKGLDWSTVGDYGNIALLTMKNVDKSLSEYQAASKTVLSQADKFVTNSSSSPYGVALTSFAWGSNMTVANAGIITGLAYQLTGEEKYLTAASKQLDYLLGTNPCGECFMTGYGTVSPENPHHRPSMAVGKAMKGMLVGGVNSALEDSAANAYCTDLPAYKRYVDNSESYSTNEITIYWNSPLTYLLSLTDESASIPDVEPVTDPTEPTTDPIHDGEYLWGDANCNGEVTLNDAVAILQYVALPGKYPLSELGLIQGDVHLHGNGISGLDALSIQKLDAKVIFTLPESWADPATPTTTPVPTTTMPVVYTTVAPVQQKAVYGGFTDYGTPMNDKATAVADFRKGSTPLFFASDGWENGDPFDCGWYASNTSLNEGFLKLTIDKDSTGKYAYSGAEYRTADHYGYGYYETSMQAIKNPGVVSSFFTYTGESEKNPWDEIDIEVLGKDTTKVQFNYYTNSVGKHEFMYDLGFDASEGFHTYGFDWQPDHITWYVDGKAVYTATENIPVTPGRIMMNTWPGRGVDGWLDHYNGNTPLTARYLWVTYNKQ